LFLGGYNRGSQNKCSTLSNVGWQPNYAMNVARHFAASVKMPDSNFFIIGGEENSSGVNFITVL